MVSDNLMQIMGNFRSQTIEGSLSDHMAILLTWSIEAMNKGIPFKFNCCWLQDPEYNAMVMDLWKKGKK